MQNTTPENGPTLGCGKPLWLTLAAALAITASVQAVEIPKTDDANALNEPASWVGGTAPGPADVALFDNTITGPIAPNLGLSQSWGGIRVTNAADGITIGNSPGAMLTLGSSGIDMSGASVDLTIASTNQIGADQTWNVASGRVLSNSLAIPVVSGVNFPRGVVNFTGAGTLRILNPNVNSMFPPWLTVGGTTWATNAGAGLIVPLAAAGYVIPANPDAGFTDLLPTTTKPTSIDFPGYYRVPSAVNVSALRVTASGAVNITNALTGSGAFTVRSIMIAQGAGPVTIHTSGAGIGAGRMLVGYAAGLPFCVIQNSVNDLTLGLKMNAMSGTLTNTIVKSGVGRLILNNPNNANLNGSTSSPFAIVNEGILAIDYDDTAGGILGPVPGAAMPGWMALNGGTFQARTNATIVANRGIAIGINGGGLDAEGVGAATTFTIAGVIEGTGDLAVSRSGAFGGGVVFNAVNTYTGGTLINSGTLTLASGASINDSVRIGVAGGATFDVSAVSGFTVASGKTLAGLSTDGTATVNAVGNALTLASGAGATFNASGAASTVGKISVTGDLALNTTPITVNVSGEVLEVGVYRLLDCTGTLTGAADATPIFGGFTNAPGTTATISTTAGSAGHVDLVITSSDTPPAGMYFSVQPPASTAAGAAMSPAVVVTVTNAAGTAYTTRQAVVTLSVVSPGGTLLGTVSKKTSLADGKATFSDLSLTLVGAGKTLRATNIFGAITATSGTFAITAAAPAKLVVATQPSATANAGLAFAQQPVIQIQDTFGNLTTSGASVTVTQNVGGTLQGTTTVAALGGVATFSGLNATNLGTIKLNFTSAGLPGVSSADIVVGPGPAAYMVITTAFSNQLDAVAFTPYPEVKLFDLYGHLTESSANVTANLASSTGGTLAGTTTVSAGGIGTATFYDLRFNLANALTPESGVQVFFTSSGLPPVTNALITVNPNLIVTIIQEPSPAAAGADISPNVTVSVTDASLNPIIGQTVTMSKLTGTGTLYGTLSRLTDGSGIATFTNLSFKVAGDKTIRATVFGTSDDSISFTITANAFTQLQVLAPGQTNAPDTGSGKIGTPNNQFVGGVFNVTVNAVDAFYNIDPNAYFLVNVTTSEIGDTEPGANTLSAGTQLFPINPFVVTNSLTVTADDGISLTNTSSSIVVVPYPIYMTKQDGNWNDFNTWKRDAGLGAGFVDAIAGQTPSSLDGIITITNKVTVTNNLSVDQVTVSAIGEVVVTNATLTIVDGTGTDMLVSGILKNQGTGVITATGTLEFSSGAKYDHNRTGGAIPTATWNTNATCEVTGVNTTAAVTGLVQEFGHFIWNCTNQPGGTLPLNWASTTIHGDFIIKSTGLAAANDFRIWPSDAVLTVLGNFEVFAGAKMSGGGGAGNRTLRVHKNVTIPGTSALGGSGSPIHEIAFGGDGSVEQIFTVNPDSITAGKWQITVDSTARVKLVGNFALGSTPFTVNGRFDFGTNAYQSGTFTANDGATLVTAHTNGLNGSLTTSSSKAFGSSVDYIYNGTASQVTGSLLPVTLNNLTNLNAVGLTISGTHTVNGSLVGGTRLEGSGNTVLTVNNLILPGTTVMKLNGTNVPTSDQFSFTTLSASGPLVITNIGPTLINGTVFTLFNGPVTGFGGPTLPGAPYEWQNLLSTFGTITLISGGVDQTSTSIVPSVAHGILTLSWPASHIGWTLQTQTNSLSVGLVPAPAAWFDVSGSTTTNQMPFTIDPNSPTVFYRLMLIIP